MQLINGDALYEEVIKIGRDESLYYLNDIKYALHEYERRIINALNNANPLDAKVVKHGKWEANGRVWKCSNCGEEDYYAYLWKSDDNKLHIQDRYCPSCGCLMDKSEAFYSEDSD